PPGRSATGRVPESSQEPRLAPPQVPVAPLPEPPLTSVTVPALDTVPEPVSDPPPETVTPVPEPMVVEVPSALAAKLTKLPRVTPATFRSAARVATLGVQPAQLRKPAAFRAPAPLTVARSLPGPGKLLGMTWSVPTFRVA